MYPLPLVEDRAGIRIGFGRVDEGMVKAVEVEDELEPLLIVEYVRDWKRLDDGSGVLPCGLPGGKALGPRMSEEPCTATAEKLGMVLEHDRR